MPFTNKLTEFSNAVHEDLINRGFYEHVFGNKLIDIIDTTVTKPGYSKEAQLLDQNYGVDYRIVINDPNLGNIPVTIQERFRDMSAKKYQDFTLTHKTPNGRPSELSKINADLFVYGYAETINGITKANQIIIVDMPLVKLALSNKIFVPHKPKTSSKSGSTFITIPFNDLFKMGAVVNFINY